MLSLLEPAPKWLQRLDYLIYDIRFNAALHWQQPTEEHKIIIVDIDEASLAQEGRWPWSRHRLAELVTKLADAGALVVGFDVVFSEAERNPVDELKKHIKDAHSLPSQWQQQADADLAFSQSFKNTDVVLGFFFLDDDTIQIGKLPTPVYQLSQQQRPLVVSQKSGYAANLASLQEQAQGGFVTTFNDSDGVVRRTPLVLAHQQQLYPSLSLAMAMSYLLLDDVDIQTAALGKVDAFYALKLGSHNIRTNATGEVTVPYKGAAFSYPYVSAKDILNDSFNPEVLADALIMVGTSTMGLGDLRTTPVGTQYPGVEVHANVLRGLLSGQFPFQPEWQAGAVLLQLLLIGLVLSWWLPKLSPLGAIVIGMLALSVLIGSNFYLWLSAGLDTPIAIAVLLTFGLLVLNLAAGFIIESRGRQMLRNIFNQYVPPAHIEQILANPGALQLTGESKELTVLFADIRNFTNISEDLSAAELKQLLNDYLTPITEIIFEHDGTIDKYVGDMVMAFWGAPLADAQHAQKSIAAALAMQQVLQKLRHEFTQRGWPEIHVGIGLNTGIMAVGDMGSSYRRAYTVLGDAVNLGARLESISKYYGAKILVSENTKQQATDFVYRYVDCIQVKGKEEPIKVFEPLGYPEDVADETYQELELLEQATTYYQQQDWSQATALYQQLNQRWPHALYEVYLQRIQQLQQQELPKHWNGVFRHEHK